jgi:hypothetical protein
MIVYRIEYRQFIDEDEVQYGWFRVQDKDSDSAIEDAEYALRLLGFEFEILSCEGGKVLDMDTKSV